MMKKFKELSEAVKDKFDIGEYDQEGDMAKSDLRSILSNAKRIHDMLEDSDNLPEWVQSKITKAEDYISTVANYMEAEMNEAVESGASKKKETEFHKKLDNLVHKTFGKRKEEMNEEQIDEVSSDLLRKAKHKAYGLSVKADEEGKTKEADKRFSQGIKFQNREYDVSKKEGEKLSKYMAQKEEVEQIDEKNVPTSPEKWAQAKAQAKAKFDVYPSAYANGWAAKKYKEMGGGWKSVSEEAEQIDEILRQDTAKSFVGYAAKKEKDDLPFTPDKPRKQNVIPGKHGVGYSTARHLARMAMQKQSEKMKKPIKEEEMSKKAQIVKKLAKKKESSDTFQDQPILSNTITKNY